MKPIFMKWMETITPWNISVALIFCSTLTLQDEYTVSRGDGFVPEAEAILITTPLCLATIIGKTILVIWKRYNFTAKKNYICSLCLFAYSDVHYILCCVFALFVFILCTRLYVASFSGLFVFILCTRLYVASFSGLLIFLLPLWYSLSFI